MILSIGKGNNRHSSASSSSGLSVSRGAVKTVVVNGTPQKYHRGITKRNGSRDRSVELMIQDGGLKI